MRQVTGMGWRWLQWGLLALLILVIVRAAGCGGSSDPDPRGASPQLGNPWSVEGNWYKGNLHTHSTQSDGKLTPQELVDLYKAANYDFLAITDHNKLTPTVGLDSRGLCLLPATEWWAPGSFVGRGYHLIAAGITALPNPGTAAPDSVAFFRSQGAIVYVAHPYWSGAPLLAADITALPLVNGMEIRNGGINRVDEPTDLWDELLRGGMRLWGFGADDNHEGVADRGLGWIVVRAPVLTPQALLSAMASGYFYATAGPTLSDVRLTGNTVTVRCSPCVQITCITSEGSQMLTGTPVAPIQQATFRLTGKERWARVEVVDAQQLPAWSNPLVPAGVP